MKREMSSVFLKKIIDVCFFIFGGYIYKNTRVKNEKFQTHNVASLFIAQELGNLALSATGDASKTMPPS